MAYLDTMLVIHCTEPQASLYPFCPQILWSAHSRRHVVGTVFGPMWHVRIYESVLLRELLFPRQVARNGRARKCCQFSMSHREYCSYKLYTTRYLWASIRTVPAICVLCVQTKTDFQIMKVLSNSFPLNTGSHTRVSFTDLQVRTTLYSIMSSTTWKCCLIAFIWVVTQ